MRKSKKLLKLEEKLEIIQGELDFLDYEESRLIDEINKLKRKIYGKKKERTTKRN